MIEVPIIREFPINVAKAIIYDNGKYFLVSQNNTHTEFERKDLCWNFREEINIIDRKLKLQKLLS